MSLKKQLWILFLLPLLSSCVVLKNNSSTYSSSLQTIDENSNILINGTFSCTPSEDEKHIKDYGFYEQLNTYILPNQNNCETVTIRQISKSSMKLISRNSEMVKTLVLKEKIDYTYEDGWYHIIFSKQNKFHSNFAADSFGSKDISFTLDKFNNLIIKSDIKAVIVIVIFLPPVFESLVKVLKYNKTQEPI